ncbi:MAG TPA: CBS domain-containing protein [Chloroflexota bacterium]|nr:CBS domain-containing protein [Chloroflexota bacterium]
MKVSEIMTRTPITVWRNTPVQEVARLMVRHDISGIPVLEADGTVAGVVSEDDLIVRHANLHLPTYVLYFTVRGEHEFEEEMRRALATKADEVMSDHLYTIAPDADIADAATLMMDKHASPLPVVADGQLVGILSRADIVRLMAIEDERAGESGAQ